MSRYSYKAYDGSGRLTHGEIEAESRQAALDGIARRGLFALDIDVGQRPPGSTALAWWQRDVLAQGPLPLAGQAALARELATLCKADIPTDEALQIIALQPRIGAATRRLATSIEEQVRAGAALSDALAGQAGVVPEHVWRLVRAGEASGTLPQVLDELAAFLEQSMRIRGQILTAMLYPLVLLTAATIAIVVIVTVMIPALLPLFRDAGVEPPFLLSALSAIERIVIGYWPVTLVVVAALAVGAKWAMRTERVRERLDRVALRLPLIGGLLQCAGTARIARTLSTLMRNGVPMMDALDITAGVVSNRALRAAMHEAKEEINQGGTLLAPLTRSGLLPPLALRLVALGERSGQLATMLARAADVYEHELQQQLQRLLAISSPLVTILIGGLVGTLLLSVMGAMLGLNEAVMR